MASPSVHFTGVIRGNGLEAECSGRCDDGAPGVSPVHRGLRIDTISKLLPAGEYILVALGTETPVRIVRG